MKAMQSHMRSWALTVLGVLITTGSVLGQSPRNVSKQKRADRDENPTEVVGMSHSTNNRGPNVRPEKTPGENGRESISAVQGQNNQDPNVRPEKTPGENGRESISAVQGQNNQDPNVRPEKTPR